MTIGIIVTGPAGGSTAITGATQAGGQTIAALPSAPLLPLQLVQSPCPDAPMSDVMAILIVMSVAWTADRPIPAVTRTARNKIKICRADRDFMTHREWHNGSKIQDRQFACDHRHTRTICAPKPFIDPRYRNAPCSAFRAEGSDNHEDPGHDVVQVSSGRRTIGVRTTSRRQMRIEGPPGETPNATLNYLKSLLLKRKIPVPDLKIAVSEVSRF